ncbi:tRNA (adenosine(37)-N6)-threonylcarbamoyltransferase complex dimerization subunit type 1 TsaB [Phenylobacterium sp.]|uniref:tRNA (adenosine(37)-N6)-threonylcarbamoyltransferase complex dimerization subunit type 1 TsaB n=1 Tax=Phenylobacterium sp. TaxID=1871053 RepID=UPI002F404C47
MVLGLDTCLNACGAAVIDGERVLAAASEPMARGHQERLATLVQEVMAAAGLRFADLDRIAVTLGPGSFTGLRVGLAFAKGLAAALDRPLAGVGVLEALAAGAPQGLTLAVLDARRDQVYFQPFRDGAPLAGPESLALDVALARAAALAAGAPTTLVGSGAALIAGAVPGARLVPAEGADPVRVARLAAGRPPAAAAPLYLRAPDARLPAA